MREGWYKVTYGDGVDTIKEGGEFQSTEYAQFGGGCLHLDAENSTSNHRVCSDDEASFQIEIQANDFSHHNIYIWYSGTSHLA